MKRATSCLVKQTLHKPALTNLDRNIEKLNSKDAVISDGWLRCCALFRGPNFVGRAITTVTKSFEFRRRSPTEFNRRRLEFQCLESRFVFDVSVIPADVNIEFRDMGYDSATGQVGIVGYEVSGATKTAKVFGINATNDGFTSSTLVGLGSGTQVEGISSDGSRISGISKSNGSIGAGEGTTWLRNSPSTPIGIGYLSGLCANTSGATSAWKDGVVGSCGGGAQAIKWTQTSGMFALGGHTGFVGEAKDVSANGSISVGFASHQNPDGAAYYWDATGIHKLNDPFNIQSIAYAISPNGNFIGGYVGEVDQFDNDYLNAAVWDANRNLTLLKDANGNRFEGKVLDVSNLGYAVGETRDGRGFIWHPSFNGAKIFENWLTERQANYSPTILSKGVEAIAEDTKNGRLLFALSDYEAPGASFYVEVDAPEIVSLSFEFIVAPTSYEFRDMGYDSATGQVGIVGYEVSGATKTAKVFGINATNDGFTASTLVGFGAPTQVFGISSDASRIAGQSKSSGSINNGEGTTWLRSSPSTPTGIGYISGLCGNTSVAGGAWKDGIVGGCGGGAQAAKWTQASGLVALGGHAGFIGEAKDVSATGSISVGFAAHQNPDGAAYYWDATGIHKLNDPFNIQSIAFSISPNGNFIGGYVGEVDQFDNDYLNAAVWDANRNLTLLKDANGDRFEGKVLDVSNLGYAVGETRDGSGFIWHKSFDGIQSPYRGAQIFDAWLATIPNGAVFSPASKGVEAIAEDTINGKLLFALSDYEAPGASAFVTVSGFDFDLPASPFSISSALADLTEDSQITVTLTADPVDFAREISVSFLTVDSRLSAPTSVSFPGNASQFSFQIDASNDLLLQGDRTITLELQMSGYDPTETAFDLLDDEADFPFSNPDNVLDVNGDGSIEPVDALIVINALNAGLGGTLVWDGSQPTSFLDTSRNNILEPLDALLVINHLNSRPSGSEPLPAPIDLDRKRLRLDTKSVDSVLMQLAIDSIK